MIHKLTKLSSKPYVSLLALLLLGATSCSQNNLEIAPEGEEDIVDPEPEVQKERVVTIAMMQFPLVTHQSSEVSVNSSLLDNWEDCKTVVLNEPADPDGFWKATLPWWTGSASALPEQFCKDINKADSWQMAFHSLTTGELAKHANYICLYNKAKSKLKLFYYFQYKGGDWSGGQIYWCIRSFDGTSSRFIQEVKPVSEGEIAYRSDNLMILPMFSGDVRGIVSGWNGLELDIPEGITSANETICISPVLEVEASESLLYVNPKNSSAVVFNLRDVCKDL